MINKGYCPPLKDQPVFNIKPTALNGSKVSENNYGYRTRIKVLDAEKELKRLSPFFYKLPHNIVTPVFDREIKGNCHGYTATGNARHFLSPKELISLPDCAEKIAFFVNDGVVCHSGRYHQNKLTHYLIGVGIVESTIDERETAEYEARYNLPEEKCTLQAYLNGFDFLGELECILGYARDLNIDCGLFEGLNTLDEGFDRKAFLIKNKYLIIALKEKIREKQPHLFTCPAVSQT